ncbi:MAG: ArsR/SmtB family transcription factor [Haloarculaceae archaeon]
MSRLLSSRRDPSVEREADPSVLYINSEQTGEVISTLAGDTALRVFRTLTEQALTASEVADRLDTSVQSVSYHLENLEDADLVEVIDTCYSEKGREMDIYGVTSEPKVLVLGTRDDETCLRSAFGQLAGAVGITAVGLAAWESLSGLFDVVADV